MPSVEIVAHRGESQDAPENTLAAFRLAWERKADAIELDVHLTADGKLIVCHDADTKRTTGVAKLIKQTTCAELQELDAGRWKGERWVGEKLPTLEAVLATIPPRARCFIEVKVGPEAIPALVQAVRESGKRPAQLAVISFHAAAVAEAKRQLPEIPAYFVAGFKQDKGTGTWTPAIEELIEQARSIGADGLDLSHSGPLDRDAVQRIKAAGLQPLVWTLDDPVRARQMVGWGVVGITTNRAGWLKQQLSEFRPD